MPQILPSNTFTTAKWVVSSDATQGTHTTIATALTSASSGDTIFIRPGTYTENLTLKVGVNLTAYNCDALTPNVTISGTCTLTAAGTVSISGIRLQTNSAALLAVTGSAASIVNLNNCYLNCTNNTGITFSTSSGSAQININYCTGNLGTTGIGLFSHSSSGVLTILYSMFTNSGASTTASTASAGTFNTSWSEFDFPITSSSTNAMTWEDSKVITSAQNVIAATLNGGSTSCKWCRFESGSASAVSIGSTAAFMELCDISSSNTNAITGAGTLTYQGLTFPSTSSTINVTTQTGSGTLQGSKNTAPAAGFLGERISSAVTGVSIVNSTPKTVTSISLTPGVWDITGFVHIGFSTFVGAAIIVSLSTVTNTLQGNNGDQQYFYDTTTATMTDASGIVPSFRVVLSSTTTYFLITQGNFTTGTGTADGRISAVRVG